MGYAVHIYIRFGYFIVCSAVAYAVYIYMVFLQKSFAVGVCGTYIYIYIYIGFRAQNQKTTGQPYMQVVTRVSAGAHIYTDNTTLRVIRSLWGLE